MHILYIYIITLGRYVIWCIYILYIYIITFGVYIYIHMRIVTLLYTYYVYIYINIVDV